MPLVYFACATGLLIGPSMAQGGGVDARRREGAEQGHKQSARPMPFSTHGRGRGDPKRGKSLPRVVRPPTSESSRPAVPAARPADVVKAGNSPPAVLPESASVGDGGPDAERAHATSISSSDAKLAAIAKAYCSNNAANAAELRIAAKRKAMVELEARVDSKSAELAKLIEEARAWTERRDKLWASARDTMVETYSKMRPEAAAQQLGAMSDEAAASIVMRLSARAASAIMSEMAAERAARLADSALRRTGAATEKSGS